MDTSYNPFGTHTYKIVYLCEEVNRQTGLQQKGVALIEASDRTMASAQFQRDYDGLFHTIESIVQVG